MQSVGQRFGKILLWKRKPWSNIDKEKDWEKKYKLQKTLQCMEKGVSHQQYRQPESKPKNANLFIGKWQGYTIQIRIRNFKRYGGKKSQYTTKQKQNLRALYKPCNATVFSK